MSRYDLEEQEQLANLKAFWAKYGNFILTVLILVFGSFAAKNGWEWWQARQSTEAVVVFEKLESAAASGDLELMSQIQTTLLDNHGGSNYAPRGALLAARVYAEDGKTDQAKQALQWVVKESSLLEYEATARLLLSGLLIEEGKHAEAKALLEKKLTGFEGLFHDRLGDIALAENKPAEANKEYEAALAAIQANSPWRAVIERKIAALPKSGE
ncbi:YfgM family protein [Limnobacter sp.]|uniref:YfgM family protein n=1 Tax=Limnobacter sp. TaxID=2003368 RepID=UPI0035182EFC